MRLVEWRAFGAPGTGARYLLSCCEVPHPFQPSNPGTPESVWREFLGHAPRWWPPAAPLVVASPHPDDETLGAGGLMAMTVARGVSVTVISVTDGEAAPVPYRDVRRIRQRELDSAMQALGVPRECICRLGLPDGNLSQHGEQIEAAVDRLAPPGALLAAPWLSDGHPDHEEVGRACLAVARRRELPLLQYPVWGWHHRSPRHFRGSHLVRVDLGHRAFEQKRAALGRYASQLDSVDPVVPPHVLRYFLRNYESYVL